jgi:hypothetical protein
VILLWVKGHYRKALHCKSLKDTICKTEKWNDDLLDKVYWLAYGKAFQSISRCRRLKYLINYLTQITRTRISMASQTFALAATKKESLSPTCLPIRFNVYAEKQSPRTTRR